ncbi:cyclase family protein [Maridesulfovibrio sp. FT414]|uniref:cyclase family protein n=1 Tax=Maridesulfovibrio sp. FT414 TaxID=2979469 RepID=UPI003D806463
MTAIIDLSHTITEEMPVYPGTAQPVISAVATHATHGFLEHRINLATHTGTHIDAPAHMIEGAATLDMLDPEMFIGPAIVIDCSTACKTGHSCEIGIDELAPFETEIAEHDFILLNTGWHLHWGTPEYFLGYPVLSPEAARWLADFDLKGIGIDVISVDPADTADYPAHMILLGQGMIIIENLTNLHALPQAGFILSCLPLKFRDSDGSPVRAVAIAAGNFQTDEL